MIGLNACSDGTPVTPAKNSENKIEKFSITSENSTIDAVINHETSSITFQLPPALEPTSSLIPIIEVSIGATVTPASKVAQNFEVPVTYTVKAENGTEKKYTVEIKPESSSKDIPMPPKYLCIYYGYPSLVNGSGGNVAVAANTFRQSNMLVLGDKLWQVTHDDYAPTKEIIALLRQSKPTMQIFGYIDLGMTTQKLSETDLKTAIDAWKVMGVTGIFADDFGYDFGVTRSRQNMFVDYAHSKGLAVFVNCWNIEDALGGSDSHLSSAYNDYYLLESFLVGHGAYRPMSEFKLRGDRAYYYMKTKKIGIACSATLPTSELTATSNTSDKFKLSWYGTAMYNFDAYQFTDMYHSSNSTLFFYPNPITSYGTAWKQADWIKTVSATRYERSTTTTMFYVEGDGATYGRGGSK